MALTTYSLLFAPVTYMAKLCKEEVTDSQGDVVKGRRRESEEEKLGSSEGMCVVLSSEFCVRGSESWVCGSEFWVWSSGKPGVEGGRV